MNDFPENVRLHAVGVLVTEALARLGHRDLVSGQEVVDLLLDVRQLCDERVTVS